MQHPIILCRFGLCLQLDRTDIFKHIPKVTHCKTSPASTRSWFQKQRAPAEPSPRECPSCFDTTENSVNTSPNTHCSFSPASTRSWLQKPIMFQHNRRTHLQSNSLHNLTCADTVLASKAASSSRAFSKGLPIMFQHNRRDRRTHLQSNSLHNLTCADTVFASKAASSSRAFSKGVPIM